MSIIAPMYNEASNIDRFMYRMIEVMHKLNLDYEFICVNDGSTDDTLDKLIEYHLQNPRIKIINLSRNFGKEVALTAGLQHSSGKAVIPIDTDLQDPPEFIEELLAKWREGYDVVYAVRKVRQGEGIVKRLTANLFYRFINKLSEVPIPKNTGDFRLIDRRVVDHLNKISERTRFMKGLFAWVGFKQTGIFYEREPRHSGKSKWNYWKLWNFAIDGITLFSTGPLKLWSYAGLFISLFSFIYGSFLLIRTLVIGIAVPGYASIMVTILFLGGIQLFSLGVLGEYLGRVYNEVKKRPLYIVRDTYGFQTEHVN